MPPPLPPSMTLPLSSAPGVFAAASSQDPVWQRLWLRCQQHEWQSLGLVGSSKKSPDAMLEIASGMARLSMELGQDLFVIDGRTFGLKDIQKTQDEIGRITGRGKRCLLVLKLVNENATSVPLAQLVDACLLGVFIGDTTVVAASRTIDEIGRTKFLGSLCLGT
jgi:hypothetical protein